MVGPADGDADAGRASGWLPADRTLFGILAGVAVLALLLRVVLLGDRVAHWDEGRVGYWIVYYQETGSFAYRRIIHGPFIQHVNRWVFALLGASDFTMRLPVAVVGGLLPLSAYLFRAHLRRVEVVAMGLFLAIDPVLLYYSRFMRSDLLVATFMFVALGLLVRFTDTRRYRYLFGATVFVGFGFAAKENAIVYVLTWVGALALLADQALFRPREHESGVALLVTTGLRVYTDRVKPWWAAVRGLGRAVGGRRDGPGSSEPDSEAHGADSDGVATAPGQSAQDDRSRENSDLRGTVRTALAPLEYVAVLAVVGGLLGGVLLFFYAQRGAGMAGLEHPPAPPSEGAVGFWQGVTDPALFGPMVESTWTYASESYYEWFGRISQDGEGSLARTYVEFLGQYVEVMVTSAAAVTVFAIFGTILERYGARTSRNLVLFGAYTGFVSVLGYPLGTDIFGPWIVAHALVPLSIPAAVGVTRVFDWGYESFLVEDTVGVAIAAVLLVLVVGQVGAVAASSVYTDDQSEGNTLVQYAQPSGDPRPELDAMAAAATQNRSGPDAVLYYGEQGSDFDDGLSLVERDRSDWNESTLNLQPLCSEWFNALPLPWYFAKDDVDVDCERDRGGLQERVATNPPPVIITRAADTTVPTGALSTEYRGRTYSLRTFGTRTTFWVRSDLVA